MKLLPILGVLLLTALFATPALAHPVEFLYEDNGDGTSTFAAMTILHGSAAGGGTGIRLNGSSVGFDSEFGISDAAWDARRAAATGFSPAGGFSIDAFTAAVVLEVTVSNGTLAGLGFTPGGAFTINTFDTSVRWATQTPGGSMTYRPTVPEPASLALLGLGVLAVVRKRRKKTA